MWDFFEIVRAYFKGAGCECRVEAEGRRLISLLRGESGEWPCVASVSELGDVFSLVSQLPIWLPLPAQPGCAEMLARVNARLGAGQFQLDSRTGLVEFNTAAELTDQVSPYDAVDCLVAVNVQVVDRYLPALRFVVRGEVSADYALARAEGRFFYRKRLG